MDTTEIRKRIHNYIDVADERLLKIINAIISEDENTIVAYTTDGKPLTLSQYRAEIELGIEDVKLGRTITDENLEKEIQSW